MQSNRKRIAVLNAGLICAFPLLSVQSAWADELKAQMPAIAPPSAPSSTETGPKLILKPGQAVSVGMQTEDIAVTDDVEFAKQQVAAYPESPEASFILAVALTRTSRVEEALKEVRRARKLADKQGGPSYFDHMITQYEDMLKSYPDDNRVRYGLAWAYYMKAYVLTQFSKKYMKKAEPASAANPPATAASAAPTQNPPAVVVQTPPTTVVQTPPVNAPWQNNWVPSLLSDAMLGNASKGKSGDPNQFGLKIPHIPGALEQAAPEVVPQVRSYYDQALKNLDELLARKPDDVWAKLYRAFLYAEYTGDLAQAMKTWKDCQAQAPNNPAPYFFLGEGYLREGNLKECLQNVSKAVALRTLGN